MVRISPAALLISLQQEVLSSSGMYTVNARNVKFYPVSGDAFLCSTFIHASSILYPGN